MRYDSLTCPHGPYCWVDPIGKKHYSLKTHHLKRLIAYVEKGGTLEGHKDVPEAVRNKLYKEDEDRQRVDKRKGGHATGTESPYPPFNNIINVLPSQATFHKSISWLPSRWLTRRQ